jgi:uncharacterized membrane protein
MTAYEALKVLHILGTVLIFGTGIGTAFFLLMAYRTRDLDAIRVTTRHVVMADWLFTAPAVIAQPITGALLMRMLGMRVDSAWFAAVVALFVLTGLCWIPVVAIQYRLRNLASAAKTYAALPTVFHRLMRWWIVLGVPAFVAVMLIVVLMVTHAGTNIGIRSLRATIV